MAIMNVSTRDLLEEAQRRCRQQGRQWTNQRADVLAIMAEQRTPVTAYELLEAIRVVHPNPKPATVYRALDFFMALGLVHKLDSDNRFILCQHHHEHHTAQFMICDDCGQVQEMPISAVLQQELEQQAAKLGFEMTRQGMEIHGHCVRCRKN